MIIERNIQHQRIRTECEESSSIRATSVLDVFEKLAAAGVSLKPGVQIRFGWSLLHLVQEDQGLRVTEPDFAIWPKQRWILTIDTTLNVLALQASLLHELGVEGEDIYFDQMITAAPGALTQQNIFMRRVSSISTVDSGWILGKLDDPDALAHEENLEAVLIASLLDRRAALLRVLTLPLGFVIVFSGDSLDQVFDSTGHSLTGYQRDSVAILRKQ